MPVRVRPATGGPGLSTPGNFNALRLLGLVVLQTEFPTRRASRRHSHDSTADQLADPIQRRHDPRSHAQTCTTVAVRVAIRDCSAEGQLLIA